MNNDLVNFIVEFSTKNLEKVEQGIKDLGDKIDDVGKKFDNASTKSNSFLTSLDGLATKLEAIGLAVGGLGLKKAFDVKNESLQLQQFSTDTGIAAKNIEALGLALKFGGFGGDKGTANQFFTNLQMLREKLMRGEITESMTEEWGNAGFKITPNAGIAEYIQTISQSLYDLDKAGRIADRMRLADSLGIDTVMERFLKEGPDYVMQALKEAGAETWLSDPTVAKRSAELNTGWEKFKNQFNKMFSDEWLQTAIDLVNVLTRLEPTLGTLINQFGGAVGDSLRGIAHFLELFQGTTSFDDFTNAIKENKDFAGEVGSAIGVALGGIIGALTGHPLLGAAIGSLIGKKLGKNVNDASNKEYQEFDWEKYRQGLPQNAELPKNTQWYAGMSMDMWNKINANTINITLDPTKPTDMTQNPDGTWTTRDGRGMTIIPMGAI